MSVAYEPQENSAVLPSGKSAKNYNDLTSNKIVTSWLSQLY